MPTPFTHLRYAQRALTDPVLPAAMRAALTRHLPEYLLGSVVADGQGLAGLRREVTHFYSYDRPLDPLPWVVMFDRHPALRRPSAPAEYAFLAAYVFHLAMDAYWTLHMTGPHFGREEWASRSARFLMLHVLLVGMDERDLAALDPALACAVGEAAPGDWLPFLPLHAVRGWQEVIDRQIRPGGTSETLDVMAPRVGRTPAELRTLVDDQAEIEASLWRHVPRALLAEREAAMYRFALDALIEYLAGLYGA
ncbi:MAG: hypothetical protein L6Q98_12555 [Anaerolineae bacterium]|nr:hypothetical protein [Anaerolineae bacterium]NUQ04603.1 hypothetical protein [Anaerolineae bacterium]